ncbi:reticulon domain protein [Trypanosoma rangeli]|uniref:Reticulon-like protein n=1 Tax=Trypanosoma rangeli TaxID=5698 RepID=A0A3R7L2P9_TRYRA|nr:reticulon domain protein [Trypanosoma rangeli]RNF06409.1 reticulon domain protein [Trypanosoma rangeli]|eukprot:RNF06409.1 reticulon domain protein [Trypanosoma rangeli]
MSLWDVLAWQRPIVTGTILGTMLSVLTVFCVMEYTMVTFLCRILQLFLLLGVVVGLTNRCKLTSDDIHCAVNRFVDYATPRLVAALETTHNVVTWRDYTTSGTVTVVSVVIAFLGNFISDFGFFMIAFVLAFTVPVVYEKKKDVIDQWVEMVVSQVQKYMGTIKTKVEEATKKKE